ncbi:hypothetical protein ISN45_Aa02g004400 [Arabidopsis thaliana x Arabidopsis arenosa]|uniref:Uncharacterized protein n=1 Tax=Arabidopsis thaliana x Arabidopsis arenosa TaxID=1240361 RepID=A0A8T2BDZ7_9BRAS|nr:hypothetical protein ISN45_Aa02g004400 [Arabidopsis thaliana x Arabidopsis arenosa]
MRPETHKIIIEKLLPAIELVKGNLKGEVEKNGTDEFVFCFENCYTEKETEKHLTQKFPSLQESDVKNFYQLFLTMIDEDSKEAYLKDAEDCASVRSQGDDTSEEPKKRQGEPSTSHKCEPNCNKHYI